MKSLNLLKSLIDLFLFLAVLGALAAIIIIPIKIIYPHLEIPVSIEGVEITVFDRLAIVIIVLNAIGIAFFIYAMFVLRNVLKLFLINEIFNDVVIKSFKVIGKSLIAAAILNSVPTYIYMMIVQNKLDFKISGADFNSLLLSISLGLLFIVISEIFNKAKILKDENDLTV